MTYIESKLYIFKDICFMHLTKVTHFFTESKSPQGYMVCEDLGHKQFYDNDIFIKNGLSFSFSIKVENRKKITNRLKGGN